MKQKEITINGKQYAVEFSMQTIMNYEEIAEGKSFFEVSFKTVKEQTMLILAAAYTADENTTLSAADLMGDKDMKAYKQLADAFVAVSELMGEFFKDTQAEEKPEPPTTEEGQGEKN